MTLLPFVLLNRFIRHLFILAIPLLLSLPLSAKDLIKWVPATISTQTLSGTITSIDVTVTTATPLSDVQVWVVPDLASYVSVSPSFFPDIPAGVPQHLHVQFEIPENISSTVLEGTVHFRLGNSTIAPPLSVRLLPQFPNLDNIPNSLSLASSDRIVSDPELGQTEFVKNQIDIFFKDGISLDVVRSVVASIGGTFLGSLTELNEYQVMVSVNGFEALSGLIATVQTNPSVAFAIHHMFSSNSAWPNDPGNDQSYSPGLINLSAAWDLGTGKTGIPIGIMDNLFNFQHSDLVGNIAGPTPFMNSSGLTDPHGTRVASIVGATANNFSGIAGVMWNASLYLYSTSVQKDPDHQDLALQSEAAIRAAKTDGVRLMNGSFGIGCTSYAPFHNLCSSEEITSLQEYDRFWEWIFDKTTKLRQAAGKPDILWVFSAGNDNNDIAYSSPARLASARSNVIAVGGVDHQKKRALWFAGLGGSNYGPAVTVSAPATDVISDKWDGSYSSADGTSFAAPFVTGVAGLMLSMNSALTASQIKSIISSTAQHTGNYDPDGNEITLLDAYAAVVQASQTQPPALNKEMSLHIDSFTQSGEPLGGITVPDNGSGDSNSSVGAISYIGSLPGGWLINVTTSICNPQNGSSDLNSINGLSATSGILKIYTVCAGYLNGSDGPIIFHSGITGTLSQGGTATFQSWINTSNLSPSSTNGLPPTGSSAVWSNSGITFPSGSFSGTGSAGVIKEGPYSVINQATISMVGPGSVSFNMEAH
jgi:hypothetical protein